MIPGINLPVIRRSTSILMECREDRQESFPTDLNKGERAKGKGEGWSVTRSPVPRAFTGSALLSDMKTVFISLLMLASCSSPVPQTQKGTVSAVAQERKEFQRIIPKMGGAYLLRVY